ncbi:Lipid A 3-O-deacylase (PagL) [Nonlabens sp. Hel1_33_55]|uniref:acyloxyacyl hydrolase n=1 Tax=Nonlabens sp. Hel1_33_55 TaxID=1336802 RepID=UPI000875CB9F|nr:acyloxyacyl hydrolase [Nonlabens sp. Hel1_33_55]SCY15534.1 Lipid A 3-O-deacylase (PagL) [Nonlabens sp. Hel1_33_55]
MLFSLVGYSQTAEDDYPFLSKTYVQFNLGMIFNDFNERQLEPGFTFEDTSPNRFSGRILLGYEFAPDWAVQYGVLRPASWFEYNKVSGTNLSKSVWTNVWSLTAKKDFHFNDRWGAFVEAGPATVARKGFTLGTETGVEDYRYLSILAAAGVTYKLSDQWELLAHAVHIPKDKENQPSIQNYSFGVQYNLSELAPKPTDDEASDRPFFPTHTLQVGYGNDFIGYAPNKIFSMNARVAGTESLGIPVFWYGDAKASNTVLANYTKTVYESKKFFSIGYGASVTAFENSIDKKWTGALSIYPHINFFFWRRDGFDAYGTYSVIGPTFITREDIDGVKTGPKVTYQDFMAAGAYFGKDRKWNAELKIIHYSNGNIFPRNDGVAVPIVFQLGYQW